MAGWRWKSSNCRTLKELSATENTLKRFLVAENAPEADGSKLRPHNVKGAHYSNVLPERVPRPYLIAYSRSCVESLNICASESDTAEFAAVFSGNSLLPGFEHTYCTNYGCHSFGQWFGQLGDGRAIILGETNPLKDILSPWDGKAYYTLGIRELQLKGSGRSPYSRGFDGRAVLRSSVREFLGKIPSIVV